MANPDLVILNPDVKSGELKFGEVTNIPILTKLSETASTGSYFSVSSILRCSPFVLDKNFSFRVGKVMESFEAVSFSVFPWYNISPMPWTIAETNSYDGIASAKSGTIPDKGTTSLMIRTYYTAADSLKFFYKVSSESGYDIFSFKLNDKEILAKSGEIPWTRKGVAISPGLNTMEWTYKKDDNQKSGEDCAWIDMIDFTGSSPVNYIRKDLQVVRMLSPVKKDKYGQETISVIVRNLGRDKVNGFYLAYSVNNSISPEKQFFDNVIPYKDSVTISFNALANLSKYGVYKIAAFGVDNNDDYLFNDTAQVSIEYINLNETLSLSTNPFIDQFTIHIKSQIPERLQISITSLSGIKLYDIEKDILRGINSIDISYPTLIPGIYYINIHGSTMKKTLLVLKINK